MMMGRRNDVCWATSPLTTQLLPLPLLPNLPLPHAPPSTHGHPPPGLNVNRTSRHKSSKGPAQKQPPVSLILIFNYEPHEPSSYPHLQVIRAPSSPSSPRSLPAPPAVPSQVDFDIQQSVETQAPDDYKLDYFGDKTDYWRAKDGDDEMASSTPPDDQSRSEEPVTTSPIPLLEIGAKAVL